MYFYTSDIGFEILSIIFVLALITFGKYTYLILLILFELIWINLYVIGVLFGLYLNILNPLALTFFFLVFSAIELSIGFVLLIYKNILIKSINLIVQNINWI